MSQIRQINASDAFAWLKCRRRAWFDLHPPEGLKPVEDPFSDLVAARGVEHEQAIREELGHGTHARSIAHTRALIEQRESLIYQPTFADESIAVIGRPDFLTLESDNDYRVIDAKLATNIKTHPEIVIQMSTYARLFPSPHRPAVILGDRSFVELDGNVLEAADDFLNDMQILAKQTERPRTDYSHSKCHACAYHDICIPDFERSKELTLIYGLDRRAVPHLENNGIRDYAALAASNPDRLEDTPYFKGDRKTRLVRQARAYLHNRIDVLSAPDLPSCPWVHFDVESDPFANPDEGIVYLWGFLLPNGRFSHVWAEPGGGKQQAAWQCVLSLFENLRQDYPSVVIAHFAHYEVQIVKNYASLFGDEAHPTVEWLLGQDSPLIDLRDIVRNHLILPLKSYGLKAICKDPRLVNFQWALEESGS